MIITKTPLRISFFGGGTDFEEFYKKNGGAVLSTTFDKYCFIYVRSLPQAFDYSIELIYDKIERASLVDDIQHPAVREALKMLGLDHIRIVYDMDLPSKSGLGTSSSFAVGLLNAFHYLRNEIINKRELADEAIYLERVLCNEAGGIQDQIAASFGGMNKITFQEDGYEVKPIAVSELRKNKLNDNLMLFFTGGTRFSSEIQKDTQKALNEKNAQLMEMKQLVDEAEKVLTQDTVNLNEFGRMLDHTWKIKRGITNKVSTAAIDECYDRAIKAGALGGKLLGAGGGGFLLFYVEEDKQTLVRQALIELKYVPFSFDQDGSKIITQLNYKE